MNIPTGSSFTLKRNGYLRQYATLALICGLLLGASSASAWLDIYGASDAWEESTGMTTDTDGNLYVIGVSRICPDYCGAPWDWDERWWIIIKYLPDGSIDWVQHNTFAPGYISGVPTDVEVDAEGNVFVTGYEQTDWVWGQFAFIPVESWTTIKYDGSDGSVLWEATFNLNPNGEDAFPKDLSLDTLGNAYVTGSSFDLLDDPYNYTVKYDGTLGTELWVKNHTADDNLHPTLIDAGSVGFAVAGTSDTCAGGTLTGIGIAKYDLDGILLWEDCYDGSGYESVDDLLVDGPDGDIYVAGSCQHPDQMNYGWEYCVFKYQTDGTQVFANQHLVGGGWWSNGRALDLDSSGNLYVAGSTTIGTVYVSESHWALVKYDAVGTVLWQTTYAGPEPGDHSNNANDIAVDQDSGDIWLAGNTTRTATGADQAVIVYNENGGFLFENFYTSGAGTLSKDYSWYIKIGDTTPFTTIYNVGTAGEYPNNNRHMTIFGWSIAYAYSGATCDWDADCFDAIYCNGVEFCDAGFCAPGTPVECSDECNDSLCDELTATCNPVPKADGTNCENGDFCDGANTCQGGTCEPGIDPCDDTVGCTDDVCNEGPDTCDHTPNDANCDNGDWCDGAETCDLINDCLPGTAPDCDDGVDCTIDYCNEINDSCSNIPSDSACNDFKWCTGDETCDPINDCQSGAPPITCTPPEVCSDSFQDCVMPEDCPTFCGPDTCEVIGACPEIFEMTQAECEGGMCDFFCQLGMFDNGIGDCVEAMIGVPDPCEPLMQCMEEIFCDGCWIDGECWGDGEMPRGNPCLYCDVALDPAAWSLNDNETCDDRLFCNGEDACLGGSCSDHSGDPCVAPEVCTEDDGGYCYIPVEPAYLELLVYLHGTWNGAAHNMQMPILIDLYINPGDPFPADSFFDVFVEVDGAVRVSLSDDDLITRVTPGSYYVVVRNINHVDLMSAVPIVYDGINSPPLVNFTDPANVECGAATLYDNNGVWNMPAGDIDWDGRVALPDFNYLRNNWTTTDPACDLDLDGYCRLGDFNKLRSTWNTQGCAPLPALPTK